MNLKKLKKLVEKPIHRQYDATLLDIEASVNKRLKRKRIFTNVCELLIRIINSKPVKVALAGSIYDRPIMFKIDACILIQYSIITRNV